jgi:uncharacterized protein involved in oxidation of intracellular sulfur
MVSSRCSEAQAVRQRLKRLQAFAACHWRMRGLFPGPRGDSANGVRLAARVAADVQVCIFLMSDAVMCALPTQTTPQGYYNIERMLKAVINKGGQVKACGTCSEARGIKGLTLLEGVEISTMSQLAQ